MLKYFDIVLFLHQSTFDWSRQKPSTKFIPQKKPSELRMAFFYNLLNIIKILHRLTQGQPKHDHNVRKQ